MKWLFAPLIIALALASPALAQGKSKDKPGKGPKHQQEETSVLEDVMDDVLGDDDDDDGHGKNKNKHKQGDDDDGIMGGVKDIIFGPDDEKTIGDYYSKNRVNVDALPPGIAMNLQRGKPLPPGIAKKNLPGDLQSQLPDIFGHRRILAV